METTNTLEIETVNPINYEFVVSESLAENGTETKIDGRHNNGRKTKVRNIMPINQGIYAGFAASFENPVSFLQYNVTVGAFTEWAATKGIHNLLAKDIEDFLADFAKTDAKMKVSKIHLGQYYRWMLNNGYEDKLQRSVLIWLAK